MATTQWSQVLAARDGSDTEARSALESLCRIYWEPLYAYVRHQGFSPEEARDLTQGFFAELIEKEFLSQVDPAKGRFRAFLFAAMRHFLSHQRDQAKALKRGGGAVTLSFITPAGEERYAVRPDGEMSPEDLFEYRWAMTVFDRAVARLRRDLEESGRGKQFDELHGYLTSAATHVPYSEAAQRLGTSESGVRSAVVRLRKRLGQCLRSEIAETVANPEEVDDEVRHLLAIVRP